MTEEGGEHKGYGFNEKIVQINLKNKARGGGDVGAQRGVEVRGVGGHFKAYVCEGSFEISSQINRTPFKSVPIYNINLN